MAPEKNGRRSVLDRVPTLERGNDQKRRVRTAHHTGPGEGPGDAVPVFAVRFGVARGGASEAGIGPGPTGGARGTRVLWIREPLISSGKPEKNPEFFLFFL